MVAQSAAHQAFPDIAHPPFPDVADQPFPDGDEGFVFRRDSEFVDSVDLVDAPEEIADPLRPMRGLVFGLLLCAPFWVGVYWLLQ